MQAVLALGSVNLIRVITYRTVVRFGLTPARKMCYSVPIAPFFQESLNDVVRGLQPPSHWLHQVRYFGNHSISVHDIPPDWHLNPISNTSIKAPERPWFDIPDFDADVGDIKTIWEASRFDWALAFAQRARSGQIAELLRLNEWLHDWCSKNPPFCGPNWKCGQEVSIRIMHLAIAALILRQTGQPGKGLVDLVRHHMQRISLTISYAIAQDNNHGTSEAAALFIGGSWLAAQGINEGKQLQQKGRKWLENRVARLIEPDGSFSQYSINYHRMMLDTLSIVEVWRRHMGLPEFTAKFRARASAAACWLATMVDPVSGDAPNIGANDGASLLPLTAADYRDFRPSVQLAMVLFNGEQCYRQDGPWNEQLVWLDVLLPEKVSELPGNKVFDNGGYAVLRRDDAMALLRYPRFRFRPSHADALHLDFWQAGRNMLRDGGSYSYNAGQEWLAYFSGTTSHNTVQFDDRDQMPRLSRFLFGDWLKTESIECLSENDEASSFGAVYRDGYGVKHKRSIRLMENLLIVVDDVTGFTHKALLRWRLMPSNWVLDGQILTNGKDTLSVITSVNPARVELVYGLESRYYLDKKPLPVLEIEIHKPGSLITKFTWPI